jgi:hypothetical protein
MEDTTEITWSQLQLEYVPADILQDRILYSALLGASAAVTVTIGGVSLGATWTDVPATGIGVYHGSTSFTSRGGDIVVTVNGIATVVGSVPLAACSQQKFNPYVFSGTGPSSGATLDITSHVCVQGFGIGNINNLCKFACGFGYCPITGKPTFAIENAQVLTRVSLFLLEARSASQKAKSLEQGRLPDR